MNDEHRDGSPLREALYTATHKKYSDEHRCSKTLAKPECAQEVNDLEDIVARREREAVRAALEGIQIPPDDTPISSKDFVCIATNYERQMFRQVIAERIEQLNQIKGQCPECAKEFLYYANQVQIYCGQLCQMRAERRKQKLEGDNHE
jgi:hypothetical protein